MSMKAEWQFTDSKSHIKTQWVSISSDMGGDFDAQAFEVCVCFDMGPFMKYIRT